MITEDNIKDINDKNFGKKQQKERLILGAEKFIIFNSKINEQKANTIGRNTFSAQPTKELKDIINHITNTGLRNATTDTMCTLMKKHKFNILNFIIRNIDYREVARHSPMNICEYIQKLFVCNDWVEIGLKNELNDLLAARETSALKELIQEEPGDKHRKIAFVRLKLDYFHEMSRSLHVGLIEIGHNHNKYHRNIPEPVCCNIL